MPKPSLETTSPGWLHALRGFSMPVRCTAGSPAARRAEEGRKRKLLDFRDGGGYDIPMRDHLRGLAFALVIVGIVIPPVMQIAGTEYMLSMLPYSIPLLIAGIVMLIRIKPEAEETPMPSPPADDEKRAEDPVSTG
jgi:hypothetical protein